MKIKKKFGERIFIEWLDAFTNSDWKSVDESLKIDNECYCYTNAFYVGQTKDFLVVCHTVGKTIENDIMGRLYIPKKWIKNIK